MTKKELDDHSDLRKMSADLLILELECYSGHADQLHQDIAVMKQHTIKGNSTEMPLRQAGFDFFKALERIEAIVEEMKRRVVP